MKLTEQQILELINKGEGIDLEFKESKNAIPASVYETICAFLNRHGGTLLLGVTDSGVIAGVNSNDLVGLKKNFVNSTNNPQILMPPPYLSINEVVVDGKIVLHIYVPESSQVHHCKGHIYDRNEDGDFDITHNTNLVGNLYHRKQATYSENKVYPYVELSDLRSDLIERSRKQASVGLANHPWKQMDDMELIKSAQLYQMDYETRKSGITLAGILLFGSDQLILSTLTFHRTDLILRKVNVDRYDDRDLVQTNLIDSYDRIIAFVQKHLPDPFYLQGTNRISLRDVIFREVASNILIHREYLNPFPAKLIIGYGEVRTENASKPHGFGPIDLNAFAPFPKNPVIGAFFREIHWADELGSGCRNLKLYGNTYGGSEPQMTEGDVFRIFIKVPEFSESTTIHTEDGKQIVTEDGSPIVSDQAGTQLGPSWDPVGTQLELSQEQLSIMKYCQVPRSTSDLMKHIGRTNRTKFRDQILNPLVDKGFLERTIPDKPSSSKQSYTLTISGIRIIEKKD